MFFSGHCKSHNLIVLLLTIIFILLSYSLPAKESELRFRHITVDQGLSNDNVNCIEQDQYGFIWIGTQEGLNRFDGFNIKVYKKVVGDSMSLTDSKIYSLYVDHKNKLWVGTQNGLCRFDADKDNFITYRLDKQQSRLNTANRITGIIDDSDNNLYVAAEMGYVYIYNREEDCFKKISPNFPTIKDCLVDENDNLWFGGRNGVYFYNPKINQITLLNNYRNGNKLIPVQEVYTLFEDKNEIWVGTIRGKIFCVDKNTFEVKPFEYDFNKSYYIYDIHKNRDGNYYIATDYLLEYDPVADSYNSYTYKENNVNGINSFGVKVIFEDIQNNLWFGTIQGGVNFTTSTKSFENYNKYSAKFSLDISNICSVLEDSKGQLWLGSFTNGINVIQPETGKKRLYMNNPDDPYSLGYGSVWSLFKDSKGRIWTCSYLGQLQRFDPITNRFVSYEIISNKTDEKRVRDIRSICEDKNGIFWMAAHNHGLIRFNPETRESKQFTRIDTSLNFSIADDWPYQVLIDHKDYIWIATPSGLSRFNPETEIFNNYYSIEDDSTSLCDNFINTLFEDSQHKLWIGTSLGLDLFDRKSNRFIHFYEKDGLPSNLIKSIIEHKPGELWIGTANGLSRLRYSADSLSGKLITRFRNYDKSDNLQDIYFWDRAVYKTNEGKLMFGCESGLTAFYPDEIHDNKDEPPVYIIDFKLYNKSVSIGDNSILTKNITQTKEITIPYEYKYFGFEFVALNYIASEKNQYRYMLENFDSDWIYADKSRTANYTNLNPGTYRFRVQASNNDGVWNEDGATIKVIIKPPYWKTLWFKVLIGIGILSLVFSYYFIQMHVLRSRNYLLEQRVKSRTSELSKLNEELIEKNNWILSQNEEIKKQNQEIFNKNKEISIQKEALESQKKDMELAYKELAKYQTHLEEIVKERTEELNQAKVKAEESDKLKSSFLANLSHEIRTPLNSIIGFSGLICEDNLNYHEKTEYASLIAHSSNLLMSLITDIIDFSKIEAHEIELYYKTIPLENILKSIEEIYKLEKNKEELELGKQVELRIEADKSVRGIEITTDEARLQQVLTNLISNALKFTPKGYVEVGISKLTDDSMLQFYVKDTGIGIREEKQAIIFERFRKIEDDTKNIFRGAGLGLAICKNLIELMGGRIWLISKPNEGSTFYFQIPQDASVGKTLTENDLMKSREIPDFSGNTVLIAEDDIANFMYLQKIVLRTKALIIHAKTGREVLEILDKEEKIDLVLMDIKMPDINGVEALQIMKEKNIDLPVIAQTAYAFSDEVKKIKAAGFKDYLAKPIKKEQLYTVMVNYLKPKKS